ncbi:PREDICTED: uncharacterized protein CXorf49 homolog [Dipodomys ordii]|uniref:Uncharacterized protein CXorf49 homolog n=1 Tax=Dipodomys ordii TaxID=10020 RepID=A0A1S3GRS6_DIPOR|nr:PREDICTED: uncharacterized protein CXorf49 homolog [Dipodomys ordii]
MQTGCGSCSDGIEKRCADHAVTRTTVAPAGLRDMDTCHEMFGREQSFGAMGGKRYSLQRARQGDPRAPNLAGDLGPPQIVRDLLGPQGNNIDSGPKLETILSGGAEFQGGRGEASSLAKGRRDARYLVLHFNIEAMTFKNHSTYQVAQGQVRILKQESCAANLSANWAEAAPASRGRNMMVSSHIEAKLASTTGEQPSRPKFRRAWEEKKTAREASRMVSQKSQWSSSDNETSEEHHRKSYMSPRRRQSHRWSHRGQAETDSPKESESTTGNSDGQNEDIFYSMPGNLLPSSPQDLKTIKEKQRRLEETSCKIKQSVIKKYPEAAAAGDMLIGSCIKKVTEEQKLLERPLRGTLGRNTTSSRQMTKIPPLEAAAFPLISGVPPSGDLKAPSTLHPGQKQYKQGNTLKKCGAWQRRKSYPVAREDDEANRDPGLQAQPPKYRSFYQQFKSDYYTRNSPVQMKQGDITPKDHATSDYQEPLLEKSQQTSGQHGCPRCRMMYSDIVKLKEQLGMMGPGEEARVGLEKSGFLGAVAIQTFIEKFQFLQCHPRSMTICAQQDEDFCSLSVLVAGAQIPPNSHLEDVVVPGLVSTMSLPDIPGVISTDTLIKDPKVEGNNLKNFNNHDRKCAVGDDALFEMGI